MKTLINNLCIAASYFLFFIAKNDLIQAQVIADETLSTKVEQTNNLYTITNGHQENSNLFHSFREFSIPDQGVASFNVNNADVKNIFARVTGSSTSNINGIIKINGSSANLFLINPNGIIFGANASLDLNGSFIATTASDVLFPNNIKFSATSPQTTPLLTVNVPIGLQFGETAQPIQINGSNLNVMSGQTLAMVGGDVLIKGEGIENTGTGNLVAREGRLELGSVAANSFVSLTPIAEGWALGYNEVQNFQDIRLTQAAVIETSGNGSGAMQLQGREILITENSKVRGLNDSEGNKAGQPLIIKASELVEVSGSNSELNTTTGTAGSGSDIKIETKHLLVRDGGFVEATTIGTASGGNLIINASETVTIIGNNDFSYLSTRTTMREEGAGKGGTVEILTNNLILRDGGRIYADTTGAGEGGTLKIDATESVELSGLMVLDDENYTSGLFARSRTIQGTIAATGKAGDIIIDTKRLDVQGGASISVASVNGGTGEAGTLDIYSSDSVTVAGAGIGNNGQLIPSSLVASTDGSGDAGDLKIDTGKLTVRDQATVIVSSQGQGNTGNLEINARSIRLDNNATLNANTTSVNTDANQEQANITLRSKDLILLRGSNITTNATGSNVIGGNINIDTDVLAAAANSDISANSTDFRGGRVTIDAQGIFGTQFRDTLTPESDITATGANSQLNGIVQINTPDVDPSRGLTVLPQIVIDPTALIAQNPCYKRQGSKFIVTGKGGLPPNPNQALTAESVLVDWVELTSPVSTQQLEIKPSDVSSIQKPKSNIQNAIVEAQGWIINDQGEVVLTAYNPTNPNPQNVFSSPAGCPAP